MAPHPHSIDEYIVAAWLTILNANHTQGPLTTYPVIYAKSSRKVQTTLQLGLHSIAQSIGSPAKTIQDQEITVVSV